MDKKPPRSTSNERLLRLLDSADATQDDPQSGEGVLTWERLNGGVHLEISAGKAMHPELGRLV